VAKISPANAFTPADEIKDNSRFSGRSGELQSLSNALESDGVQIVIYGNRGVGKSSLAHQLESMAKNDVNVISRLSRKPTEEFDFLTVYFRCDDSVTTIPKLMLRLLSDEDALAPWVPFRLIQKETSLEGGASLNVRVISLSGKAASSITEASHELETDIASVFTNSVDSIIKAGVTKNGILFIIDEFDRIKDRIGIASILKVLGPKKVKFALVGVSTNVQDLIKDHESVARQLADGSVFVPPMNAEEMRGIISKAEELIERSHMFHEEAINWIINVAKGHPFYVHLIGKHALLRAMSLQNAVVTKEIAEEAMKEIALKGSAPIQEALYKTAIGHSYVRECVLKSFSSVGQEEIHTSELYASIARQLQIDPGAISTYVGHLSSDRYGKVLEKTRERYYRFGDSLFKAYCAFRPYQLMPGDLESD
jgi:Cdc6-like AAA superfamily ATPase